jgi:hypothetical protein
VFRVRNAVKTTAVVRRMTIAEEILDLNLTVAVRTVRTVRILPTVQILRTHRTVPRVVAPVALTIRPIIGVRTMGTVRQVQAQGFLVRNAVTTTAVVTDSRYLGR